MKVLFTFGGIPHYLDSLMSKLGERGIEVVVVTPEKGNAIIGKGVKLVEAKGYKNIRLPEKRMFYGKNAFLNLAQAIDSECPDILVLGWPYFLQIFFQPSLRKAIKRNGTKLVIREIPFQTPPYNDIKSYFKRNPVYDENMQSINRERGFYIRQWIIARIRKYCYSKAAGTLNYSTIAYDILPSYGVSKECIHVTYNTTDTEALLREMAEVLSSEAILPACGQRVLHIGRLVKWKRVDLLIDAFSHVLVTHPKAELVIIGDGPETTNLKQQAQKLGIDGCIRFVGAIYDSKTLGAYMNESTIYVLAGMGGLSINDAMTYGLPIICSVCDGTERDLVTDGINGLFFEENNPIDLSTKINRLLADADACKRMGKESERIIMEKININAVAKRFHDAFLHIMQS